MQVTEIIFLGNAVILVLASIGVVLIKNPVRATFLLILSFLPTTVIYFFLHAAFVGVLQILVYAGAILVLFTFVVMMVNPAPGDAEIGPVGTTAPRRSRLVALGVVLLLAGVLLPVVLSVTVGPEPQVTRDFGGLASIGKMLFSDTRNNPFILSFELLSFLVLAGIVVATSLARGKSKPDRGSVP